MLHAQQDKHDSSARGRPIAQKVTLTLCNDGRTHQLVKAPGHAQQAAPGQDSEGEGVREAQQQGVAQAMLGVPDESPQLGDPLVFRAAQTPVSQPLLFRVVQGLAQARRHRVHILAFTLPRPKGPARV